MDGPAFPTDWPGPPASGGRAAASERIHLFGKDGFSFRDLLDIINPLQHIPVVSTIYRKVTGDTLDALPRLAGGTLFGGIAGAVSAVVNLAVKAASGRDIGANVLAVLGDGLGLSGGAQSGPELVPGEMLAGEMLAARSAPAAEPPGAVFSAGWLAAMAQQYCDAECLDPKRSLTTDAARHARNDAIGAAGVSPPQALGPGDQAAAAARYAETTELAAAAGRRLDMHG